MKTAIVGKTFWQRYGMLMLIAVLALATTASVAYAVGSNVNQQQYGMQNTRQIQSENSNMQHGNGRKGNMAYAGDGDYKVTPLDASQASNDPETAKQLAYTIEEEKLAYDVYSAMYDKWGARYFDNISRSENGHQDMVLSVMASRNLHDPRSDKAGVFTNPELQKWYDELIAKGNKSLSDAIQVGIEIEEQDIAELKKTIASLDERDTDLKEAYNLLLQASEHHLEAFNRQAGH